MENISDANFQEEVTNSEMPVVVDFWAEWCMPCKMLTPVLEEVSKDMEGKAKVVKMNIDDNQDTPQKFGVTSIPTIIIFKNGEAVENIIGAVPKIDIINALKKYL